MTISVSLPLSTENLFSISSPHRGFLGPSGGFSFRAAALPKSLLPGSLPCQEGSLRGFLPFRSLVPREVAQSRDSARSGESSQEGVPFGDWFQVERIIRRGLASFRERSLTRFLPSGHRACRGIAPTARIRVPTWIHPVRGVPPEGFPVRVIRTGNPSGGTPRTG